MPEKPIDGRDAALASLPVTGYLADGHTSTALPVALASRKQAPARRTASRAALLPAFSAQRATAARSSAQTLKKGMRVFVAGKLVQRSWQDNDGNKRQTVEIQVTPRRTGSPVRYRRGHKVDRRGFGFVLGREVLGRRKADPRRWLRSESLRHSRRLSQATSTTRPSPAEPGVRARSKETLAGRCVEHVRERPVGLQNPESSHAATLSYSWMSPPRTSRR